MTEEPTQNADGGALRPLTIGPEYIASMRGALVRLYRESAQFDASYDSMPVKGSPADLELEPHPEPAFLASAILGSTRLIESASEHITALVKIVTEPIETTVAWTCVRSMLEPCAIAAWLLDPSIGSKTRIGRALAHRYEGLVQQIKLARSLNGPEEEIENVHNRINEVENDALRLGFPAMRDSKGRPTGIGEAKPGATEIIARFLDEEHAYRLLSNFAHPQSWALENFSFKPEKLRLEDLNFANGRLSVIEESPQLRNFALLAVTAARAFARPLWYRCKYFGWDQACLVRSFERAFDTLKAHPSKRFWRQS